MLVKKGERVSYNSRKDNHMRIACVRFFDIFCKLVGTHLLIARKGIVDQVINLYIWAGITLVVMGYIMQSFGLMQGYGLFQLASIMAVVGLFEVYATATKVIMDIEGDRSISYYLTLPARPSVVLLSMVSSYAVICLMLTFVLLPFGKMIFFHDFNLATISWLRFVIMAILANVFFAIFTMVMVGKVGTISKMRNIWMRFMVPLWWLGCYQFSWKAMYGLSMPLGYLLLCNPVTFITEGMRASLLGQSGFLPWELCCAALCCYIMIFWFYAYYKMKRLLDFV